MSAGISMRLFEAGHCLHPGFVVRPGLGLRPREFPAAVALVEHPAHGRVLFDTGYHPRFHACTRPFPERVYAWMTPCRLGPAQTAAEQLDASGIAPDSVQHLVLSHFHADHVAGLVDFPDARLHAHPRGPRFIASHGRLGRVRKGYLAELLPPGRTDGLTPVDAFPLDLATVLRLDGPPSGLMATDFFGDGSVHLVDLPGHAAGQIGMLVRLAAGRAIFLLADAAWLIDNIRDAAGPHPLSALLCDDRAAFRDTLRRLRALYLRCAPSVTFVPTHCRDTVRHLIAQNWIR